jgi:hypothetical protein
MDSTSSLALAARPEVRRRIDSRQLQSFESESFEKQSQSQGVDLAEELFGNVYALTKGHPFANAVAISQIRAWKDAGESITADFIRDHQTDLLQEIYHVFIENYVFSRS